MTEEFLRAFWKNEIEQALAAGKLVKAPRANALGGKPTPLQEVVTLPCVGEVPEELWRG